MLRIVAKIHNDVEKISGVGIQNLCLYLETTTNCPLVNNFISSYLDKSSLFLTNDLIETAALSNIQLFPICVENREEVENTVKVLIEKSNGDGY